ncbi:MAG: response regulator [Bacteroidia bacterium]
MNKEPLLEKTRTSSHAAAGKKILIVDDDDFMRYAISYRLKEEGFSVLSASDGGQAIELINEKQQHPDLILLDLMMPYISGVEFLHLIREKYPLEKAIPVIIISSLGQQEVQDGGYKLEGYHFIEKPIALDELVHWINHFLAYGEN